VKQADLVFALYLCGGCFDLEQKRRDFIYYEAITVRDSSLSASIQSIVAAEIGHFDLAYNYLRETAFVDIWDLAGNTQDGLHLASLAGAWLAVVAGFGGLRDHGGILALSPRLPAQLTRICFRLVYRGRHIRVDIRPEEAQYEFVAGETVRVLHHGMSITLEPGRPQVHAIQTCTHRRPWHLHLDESHAAATWEWTSGAHI
jgi:alpha,alpha-trehalose phosphorylase